MLPHVPSARPRRNSSGRWRIVTVTISLGTKSRTASTIRQVWIGETTLPNRD